MGNAMLSVLNETTRLAPALAEFSRLLRTSWEDRELPKDELSAARLSMLNCQQHVVSYESSNFNFSGSPDAVNSLLKQTIDKIADLYRSASSDAEKDVLDDVGALLVSMSNLETNIVQYMGNSLLG